MRQKLAALFALSIFGVLFSASVQPPQAFAETMEEQRARLEKQLAEIEADIQAKRGVLQDKQKERTTLERDVSILDNKISQAKLSIKKTDLSIKQLQGEITDKEQAISALNERIDRSHASMAQLIRQTHQIDETSLVELTLGGTMSDILDDVDNFSVIQRELESAFAEMALLKGDLSERKRTLEDRQNEEEDLRKIQVLEKQSVEKNQKVKQQVLDITKGQEKAYQKVIAEKEKTASEIRSALFGLRDSAAIPFGKAYDYAKDASAKTGVRPALILAILTQESNLGENVGSCYVKDLSTGSGVGKNTGRVFQKVMKAPRDTDPFKTITDALGISWQVAPVSCPQASGYGGAMGPSQFIPSTWMLYKDSLANLTGETFADPWNARTAIFATAMLMRDNGADETTRVAERRAALRYFAGANWSKKANAFYGDSVMELVDGIQAQINILEG